MNLHPSPASYADFDLEEARACFQLTVDSAKLFAGVEPIQPSELLSRVLERGKWAASISEKSRSEFVVSPILLEACALLQTQVSIFSGAPFNVDPERGLKGVCDFILARGPAVPIIQSPVLVVVEAKKHDIESGLGQCAAELVAAQLRNEREGTPLPSIHGVVTTGDEWQFLRLSGQDLVLDAAVIYLNQLPQILGILRFILA